MMKSHYAPSVPLILHSPAEMASLPHTRGEAFLFFTEQKRLAWLAVRGMGEAPGAGGENREADFALSLSQAGSVLEAAANLFARLHQLEKAGPSRIHAESLPEEGLGEAVNDRLRRASAG
jgi:L-threonylcarbamoyladenylate synthase